jgi:putative ABC transport system permease protein
LVLIALIALTISGIGIMNIMLVTVTERTREIGVRMAIGARRSAILYQFLIEALVISGGGAIVGILIAVLIPAFLNFLIGFFPEVGDINIPVSWASVLLAFVVSCSTGLIFGYLPASRASKLHPTESLRYE